MNNFFDEYIGTEFKEIDNNGNYLGCILPVYLLYPDAVKFKCTDGCLNELSILKNIINDGIKIDYPSNFGDVVLIKSFGKFHLFVFIENHKYVHMDINNGLHYINMPACIRCKTIGVYRHKREI